MGATVEPEMVLLASLAFENRRIDAVADEVKPEDFSDPFLGHVFGLMTNEWAQGRAANPVTLRPLLAKHPSFEAIGGNAWLASMLNCTSLALPAADTARLIARHAKRRRLAEGLSAAIGMAEEPGVELEKVADAADQAIVASIAGARAAAETTAGGMMGRLLKSFDLPRHGVRCGVVPSLDQVVGPLRRTDLAVMAGRPGMGKTATALSYALGAARAGHGVLFVSLEMGGEQLAARMAADLAFDGQGRVPFAEIVGEHPTIAARRAVADAGAVLDDMAFAVVDAGSLTLARLAMIVRRNARRMAARGQSLDLVVVDYLQLLNTDARGASSYERVSEVSRGLKQLAKDAGVAVLALAQLSREVEKRADKRPQLSDLRDSGQIEQDADVVLLLLREEYYLRKEAPARDGPERYAWEQALAAVEGRIEFICAKRRNGCEGVGIGQFHGQYQAVRA